MSRYKWEQKYIDEMTDAELMSLVRCLIEAYSHKEGLFKDAHRFERRSAYNPLQTWMPFNPKAFKLRELLAFPNTHPKAEFRIAR